jgi:hypothetical protein
MDRGVYSEAELFRDHEYVRPHRIGSTRVHGGFDADGVYRPPRAAVRVPALRDWERALEARGGRALQADASILLRGPRFPNEKQQRFLLAQGHERSFWNTLTITGIIEGRGRLLAEMTFPELQPLVVEDISAMAIGHLGKGLLKAHGLDEGGEPEKGIGGHDVMWFALRDLALGARDWPEPLPPERIGRDVTAREMPELPRPHEELLKFLMNLLIIEFRAEIGFATTQATLLDPELLKARRAGAAEAAEVVERIRTDERIHVHSLLLYLGELRSVTFRTQDGGTVAGHRILDPVWADLVRWATEESPKLQAEQQRRVYRERLLAEPDGEALLARFEALGDL